MKAWHSEKRTHLHLSGGGGDQSGDHFGGWEIVGNLLGFGGRRRRSETGDEALRREKEVLGFECG